MITFRDGDFRATPTENRPCVELMKIDRVKTERKLPGIAVEPWRKPAVQPMPQSRLTAKQIALLRRSFAQVDKKAGIAALAFYRNLFTLAPSLRGLFQSDIEIQGRKLMEALSFTIDSLERPAELTPVLEALGRRHTGYGAREEHYPIVADALLLTLKECLGREFTPRLARIWMRALTQIADVMKRGAASAIVLNGSIQDRAVRKSRLPRKSQMRR